MGKMESARQCEGLRSKLESILSTHFIAVELMWNNRNGCASRFFVLFRKTKSRSRFSCVEKLKRISRALLEQWALQLFSQFSQFFFANAFQLFIFNLIENTCTFARFAKQQTMWRRRRRAHEKCAELRRRKKTNYKLYKDFLRLLPENFSNPHN